MSLCLGPGGLVQGMGRVVTLMRWDWWLLLLESLLLTYLLQLGWTRGLVKLLLLLVVVV